MESGKDSGDLPADIAGLEALALGRGQVDLDLHLSFLGLPLDLQVRNAVDRRQRLLHLLRRAAERRPVRAVEADDDCVVGPGQHLPDALAQIRLNVPGQPGIPVDHSLDSRDRCLVIGLGIDGQPELTGVDADHLVSRHRAPQMGADVRHARHGTELARGLSHDAGHRRMRRAGDAHPVDHQGPLLERRQEGLTEQRPDGDTDRQQTHGGDEREAWGTNRPREKRVVAAPQPPDER